MTLALEKYLLYLANQILLVLDMYSDTLSNYVHCLKGKPEDNAPLIANKPNQREETLRRNATIEINSMSADL